MHGRLSGTGRLHDNRLSGILSLEQFSLDNFWFTMVICTG